MKVDQYTMDKIMSSFTIDEGTGCWEWMLGKTGAGRGKHGSGYPQISIGGKKLKVHRIMCQNLGEGQMALHKCDNPGCINPDHLYAGTHSDNMKDSWRDGSHVKPSDELAPNKNVKLGRDDVIGVHLLYLSGATQKEISEIAGCSQVNISKIVTGKTWQNVYGLFGGHS